MGSNHFNYTSTDEACFSPQEQSIKSHNTQTIYYIHAEIWARSVRLRWKIVLNITCSGPSCPPNHDLNIVFEDVVFSMLRMKEVFESRDHRFERGKDQGVKDMHYLVKKITVRVHMCVT